MGLFDIFKKKNTDANVQNESAEKTLGHETELKVAEQALHSSKSRTLSLQKLWHLAFTCAVVIFVFVLS